MIAAFKLLFMKKILDNNLFVGVLIALQILFLVAGVTLAIYDDGHASVVFIIMAIGLSFIFSIIFALIALIVSATKKWYYLVLMLFWVLLFAFMYYENLYADDYGDVLEEIEMEQMLYEEMQRDSIRLDSINKVNAY